LAEERFGEGIANCYWQRKRMCDKRFYFLECLAAYLAMRKEIVKKGCYRMKMLMQYKV
jgi:hypothetical protein